MVNDLLIYIGSIFQDEIMWTRFRSFAIILLALIMQSCAEDDSGVYPTYRNYTIARNVTLLNTSSYQQTTNYTCGPAVIMTLMHYYGIMSSQELNSKTEMRIANEMGTTTNGTTQLDMVHWLEKNGFDVQYGSRATIDMLFDNLKHGTPTIIVWNDWSGHSMLVIGYHTVSAPSDGEKDILFIADPSTTSSITENKEYLSGVNAYTPNQLKLNWFNAEYFYNPSHTEIGMYIVAVPKNRSARR